MLTQDDEFGFWVVVAAAVAVGLLPLLAGALVAAGKRAASAVSRQPSSGPSASRTSPLSFFLGGQSSSWYQVGFAMFATRLGTEVVVGLPTSAVDVGIRAAWPQLLAFVGVFAAAYLFFPIFSRSRVYSLPEYADGRFGSLLSVYLSLIFLFLDVLVRVFVTIYYGSVVIRFSIHWDVRPIVSVLVLLAGAVSLLGGFSAVIRLQTLSGALLMSMFFILIPVTFSASGGWADLTNAAIHSSEAANAGFTTEFLHALPASGSPDRTGVLLAGTLFGLWSYSCDPDTVQIALSARTRRDAKAGAIFSGILMLLTPFALGVSGLSARLLFTYYVACSPELPCLNSQETLTTILEHLVTSGVRGVLLGICSLSMVASLCASLNATSTIVTMDLFRRASSANHSPSRLVLTGRLWVFFMTACALYWVSQSPFSFEAYINGLEMAPLWIGVPIGVVLLIGAVWPRLSGVGALIALLCAHVPAVVRVVAAASANDPRPSDSSLPAVLVTSDPLHFAAALGGLAGLVALITSLFPSRSSYDDIAVYVSGTAMSLLGKCNPEYLTTASLINLHDDTAANDPYSMDGMTAGNRSELVDIEMPQFSLIGASDMPDFAEELGDLDGERSHTIGDGDSDGHDSEDSPLGGRGVGHLNLSAPADTSFGLDSNSNSDVEAGTVESKDVLGPGAGDSSNVQAAARPARSAPGSPSRFVNRALVDISPDSDSEAGANEAAVAYLDELSRRKLVHERVNTLITVATVGYVVSALASLLYLR